MCTILLPERIDSSVAGYSALAKLYLELQKLSIDNKKITIDFSQCREFDGNLCAAMGAIFDLFSSRSAIMLQRPSDRKVRKVLSRNHFLRAWRVETDIQEKENYVKYSSFRSKDSEEFKRYIDEWLIGKQKFPEHSKAVGDSLVESIYEIYANASMHGGSEYVYSCGEYKESITTFEMAIVDLGYTIPDNVNTFLAKKGLSPFSECDAIGWAFVRGNTTKENTGGLGLSLLKEFIDLNQGALHMVSGRGFVEYSDGNFRPREMETAFPGTIVNIKFNFSDSKHYRMTSEKTDINDLL